MLFRSDTYDAAGSVLAEQPVDGLDRAAVAEAMTGFVGDLQQAAPPFSAKKHQGVRYYEMARRGEEVPEALKAVEVFEFEATGEIDDGRLPFRVSCSSGTAMGAATSRTKSSSVRSVPPGSGTRAV